MSTGNITSGASLCSKHRLILIAIDDVLKPLALARRLQRNHLCESNVGFLRTGNASVPLILVVRLSSLYKVDRQWKTKIAAHLRDSIKKHLVRIHERNLARIVGAPILLDGREADVPLAVNEGRYVSSLFSVGEFHAAYL